MYKKTTDDNHSIVIEQWNIPEAQEQLAKLDEVLAGSAELMEWIIDLVGK